MIAIAIENAQLYGEFRQYAGSLEWENRRLKFEVWAVSFSRESSVPVRGCAGSLTSYIFDLFEESHNI